VDRLDPVGRLHPTILHIYGKVGTEQSTQPAVDTVSILDQLWGMVAFGVGAFRHDENTLRAELDAIAASFAPFVNDVDDAMRNLDTVSIQRLSPIAHSPS
jgi:hypothetical protein